MPAKPPHPRCKHCKHQWSKHLAGPTGKCAQKVPTGWVGWGKSKRPIMGYCPCIGYEPKEDT